MATALYDMYGRSSSGTGGNKADTKGSASETKQKLGFDAGASERERLKAATIARVRNEKERAKMQLTQLQRQFEHNRLEVISKNTEVRRLESEIFRSETEIRGLEQSFNSYDAKDTASNLRKADMQKRLHNEQALIIQKKKEVEDKKREEIKVQAQMAELQRQLAELRRDIQEGEQKQKESDLEAHHLEGAIQRDVGELQHVASDRSYKQKEVDNKKKVLLALEQKKKNAANEITRLTTENKKLEAEIRALEARINTIGIGTSGRSGTGLN